MSVWKIIKSNADNEREQHNRILADIAADVVAIEQSIPAPTAGLEVTEGANAKQGVATLIAGTILVANTSVTANSRIFVCGQDDNGGTPGFLRVTTINPGSLFEITSSSATDTSIVVYEIFETKV